MAIRHAYQSATANASGSEISSNRWNEDHTVDELNLPLVSSPALPPANSVTLFGRNVGGRMMPAAKRARKRARVIEVQAAEIAQSGNEAQFYALMQQWLEQKPQLPEEPGIDLEQLFMAQVAMQLQRMEAARRLFEQDEEEALIALLLA